MSANWTMKAYRPFSSALSMRLHFLIAYITAISLFLTFDDGVLTNAFLSSQKGLLHRSTYSLCISSVEGELSELELLQKSLYQKEFENLRTKSTWLDSMKQLPFDCTGCGNCCKTTGNVYMSPEEVSSAASYKNMTVNEFIDLYADYRLENTATTSTSTTATNAIAAGGGDVPWILLQNQEPKNSDGPAACVFLDRETNQCGIYSARPIQCSTYPFWSNILESEEKWNDEVRAKDSVDDNVNTDDDEKRRRDLPVWTPDGGGCEGMKILNGMETESNGSELAGVVVDKALEQLSLYKRADRRLPRSYNKIRLRKE